MHWARSRQRCQAMCSTAHYAVILSRTWWRRRATRREANKPRQRTKLRRWGRPQTGTFLMR